MVLHTIECASTGLDRYPPCFFLNRIHPSGVAVNVVEEYLILVAAAGALQELASLVYVDCGFRLVYCYKDVVLL